jgi:hypothetical protein
MLILYIKLTSMLKLCSNLFIRAKLRLKILIPIFINHFDVMTKMFVRFHLTIVKTNNYLYRILKNNVHINFFVFSPHVKLKCQ